MEMNVNAVENAPVARPSAISRILMVFYKPSALFPSLTGKIDWLLPLIIVAVLGGLIGHLTRPIYTKEIYPMTMKNIEKYRDQMGAEQYAKIKARIDQGFQEAMANPFKWYYPFLFIGIPFIISVIIAGVGFMTGNFMFGGKAGFWILMNVVLYASLIGLLGDLVRGLMMILKDTMFVYTGLGLLKPVDDGSFLFYLFRQVDIFSIWRIAVTAIGCGIVYKMKPKRFGYVLFGIWVVFILLVSAANMFVGGTIVY
ncbi:membrane hypothetical protein [Candidatus Zixiibacteriota bacterium]|nr:membrane hypothetical protein [candidate division Zixibacteria bacterium]